MGQTYDIQPMTSKSANEIIKWTYETPYQLYNMTDDEETIQELLDGTYFQADDRAGELAGYFCFGENAQVPGVRRAGVYKGHGVLDIGLGMHPDRTGKGLGLAFFNVRHRVCETLIRAKYAPLECRCI
ncbi:hypothetical protein RWE15_08615 [Virgibacillus halophilus]|uniref:N-acetyltransferase domain-containing protein n=1 Tax=Tigheibacillus halophilus TaxID=361280 RepID=A0ABU5C594_9BACI|nr:hypothetical protein [Virgibacillus halophilus]